MTVTLGTKSVSEFYTWLLHTSGEDLATGIRLGLGNGSALPIGVISSGLLLYSPANERTVIASQATKERPVSLTDAHGVMRPRLFSKLTGNVTNNTVTPQAVPGFGVTLEVDSMYDFRMRLFVRSAATATGVQLQLSGPTSQISDLAYYVEQTINTTLATNNVRRQQYNALATNFAAGDAPAANTTFIIEVEGYLVTDAATPPASDMGLMLTSEVAASTVTLMKGSWMEFVRI